MICTISSSFFKIDIMIYLYNKILSDFLTFNVENLCASGFTYY